MKNTPLSAVLVKATALLATASLMLVSVPASGAALSAKPTDKTPGSSSKGNKPETSGSSTIESSKPGDSQSGSEKNQGKPETSVSAEAQTKAEIKEAAKAEVKANPKLTGPAKAAAAKASKEALLPTDNYIIVFKAEANLDEEVKGIGALKANVGKRFENAFKGVSVRLNEKQLAGLSRNPNISIIEKDSAVALIEPVVSTQANAPWGLDRVDQLTGRDSVYSFSGSGTGVTAYVIDTGILANHSNFGGRVSSGFSAIGGGTEDCNGHGTHVAGSIGSATYGVAKSVSLVPVRVLDCNGSGTISGVIAGVDWVAGQTSVGLKVANMSLGGGASNALDTAVNGLISKGTTVVVAAGNDGANACNYSPARVPAAITVAASDIDDTFASFSNRGSCVDIIAPGSGIVSTWHTSTSATNTISGTSMASPHVAGAVALFLQRFGPKSPAEINQIVKSRGSTSVFSSLPTGTPNLLLHTDPENKIPLSAPVATEPVPTSPTKGTKRPRRAANN